MLSNLGIISVETTGTSLSDEVIEICIMDQNGTVQENLLIRPTRSINSAATDAHGLENSDLFTAPLFIDVAERLGKRLAGFDIIYAIHAEFTRRLLAQTFDKAGRQLPDVAIECLCDHVSHYLASKKQKIHGRLDASHLRQLFDISGNIASTRALGKTQLAKEVATHLGLFQATRSLAVGNSTPELSTRLVALERLRSLVASSIRDRIGFTAWTELLRLNGVLVDPVRIDAKKPGFHQIRFAIGNMSFSGSDLGKQYTAPMLCRAAVDFVPARDQQILESLVLAARLRDQTALLTSQGIPPSACPGYLLDFHFLAEVVKDDITVCFESIPADLNSGPASIISSTCLLRFSHLLFNSRRLLTMHYSEQDRFNPAEVVVEILRGKLSFSGLGCIEAAVMHTTAEVQRIMLPEFRCPLPSEVNITQIIVDRFNLTSPLHLRRTAKSVEGDASSLNITLNQLSSFFF